MASPLNVILKMRITKLILLSFCFLFLASTTCPELQKYVRVAIIQDAASLRLKINGFYEVIDSAGNKILYRGRNLNTTVTAYRDGILLGNLQHNTGKLFIKPSNPDAISAEGRRFRGSIQFIKKDNGKILAINHVELEDYIKGILYHEVSHFWPMEALKAQAIVSRTYAVYQCEMNKLRDFDVTSDIYSQVYGGRSSERYRTNKAVKYTTGLIITYQDKPIPAYFHATCAGHTEDASILWNINLPPLKGVPCDFCKDSPHFEWHAVLSLNELEEKLVNAGYKIKNIKNIIASGRDDSGRLRDLEFVSDGSELKLSAKDFRNAIGPNIIRSTNFNVSVVESDAVFEGVGWGHGVGLCQWGAYFMSKKGYNYEQILQYYYPGTKISRLN